MRIKTKQPALYWCRLSVYHQTIITMELELLKYLSDRADMFEVLDDLNDCDRFIDETERFIVESLHMYRTTLEDRSTFERPNDWRDVTDFFGLNLNLWSFETILRAMHEEDGIFYYYLGKLRLV